MRLFAPITEKEVIKALSMDGSGYPSKSPWATRQIAFRIALARSWSAPEKFIWARFQKDVYAACRKAEKAGKIERHGPERYRGPGLVAMWQLTRKVVLCQDCLAIASFSWPRHNSEEPCPCGGDYCGCDSCQDIALRLRAGERDGSKLSLNDGRTLTFWCEETGTRGAA